MCFKRKEKSEFDYNRFLKPICEVLTDHKHRKLIAWDEPFSDGGCKYPNRHDFYYKCKVCGYVFFNHKPRKEDLKFIKEYCKKEKEKEKSLDEEIKR